MREKGHACRSLASWQEFGSDMFDTIVGHICGHICDQGVVKVWFFLELLVLCSHCP